MRVLLIVDMQKGFVNNDKYMQLNEKISRLINKGDYDKYIFTQYINDKCKNPFFQDKLGWKGLTLNKEQEFSLNLPENSIIFEKYGYGLQSRDLEYIKSLNIDSIDICGIKAEACVYAIALQLWDNNVYPNLLNDYICGDVDMTRVYFNQFGDTK